MMWLYNVLFLVGATLGQYPNPQPPTAYLAPGNTVTRTSTITAIDCRTQDVYSTNTVVVYSQQAVTVVLCTKNLATETVQRQIVTPVNDRILVRTRTQQLQPRTSVVTDVYTNYVISTITHPVAATLTHISQLYYSTTLTETLTQTITRTNLVTRTRVNTRTYTVTTVQTILNTIIVEAQTDQSGQRPAVGAGRRPAARSGIRDGQVLGFGGEAAGGAQAGSAYRPPVSAYQPPVAAARSGIRDGQVIGFGGEAAGGAQAGSAYQPPVAPAYQPPVAPARPPPVAPAYQPPVAPARSGYGGN